MDFVDLRSDTVTVPTPAMREAMAAAPVGDDVMGEDPTVNALEARVAQMLGKQRALFVPSGTMANLLAVVSQTRPGDSVILHQDAHPYVYESGNLAMVAGVLVSPRPGACGLLDPDDVAAAIVRTDDHHRSNTTLVMIENTTNRGGGAVYPIATVETICQRAHEQGLRVHCDGARIFNAVIASGTPAPAYARPVDTISFCFSKGLGAPVGSILAGEADVIDRAHRYRKMLGGGMRQAGILAAAALHALDRHVDRLAEDHARAAAFLHALTERGIAAPLPAPTNIVFFDMPDAAAASARLAEEGLRVGVTAPTRLRAVFHLGIDDQALARAIDALRVL